MNEMPDLSEVRGPVLVAVNKRNDPLPDPDMVSYYALESDRKLYLDREIDRDTLALQRMILRFNMEDRGKAPADRKPILLYIFSYGGDVDYMWGLIDAIETSETPVYTVNMGVAASAAAQIFMAGHKRFMLSRAKVVIHEGSARMAGDSVKVLDASDSYRKTIKQMKEYILSRTAITPARLSKQHSHDWELDSAYCLEHRVCDSVVKSLGDIL